MKIVFVGLGGVPFSNRATDVRLEAFAELFINCGYEVEIINRFSTIKNKDNKQYRIYEPFKSCSPHSFVGFFLLYVIALLKEPLVIFKSHFKDKIDILFVSTGHFIDFIVYRLVSWIIGAKLVNQYCEAQSSFSSRGLYFRINGIMVDRIAPKLWDGAVCISHYLDSCCKLANKEIKTIIVYPLCDFTPFDQCVPNQVPKYFLFCASIAYKEIVDFILKAYRMSSSKNIISLRLVLAGSDKEIQSLKEENPDVTIESNLIYSDLIRRYKEATALLIPLRNTIQDIARFPNKTCEYCAAKGVVITTSVGEMNYVFNDMENALVASDYTIPEYVNKMDWIANNLNEIGQIKEKSYNTGLKYFSIDAYANQMEAYIEGLVK